MTQLERSTVIDFGGDPAKTGSIIHFSHANGVPPRAYRALIESWRDRHRVIACEHRPLRLPDSAPQGLSSWRDLADDLLHSVAERVDQPIIGVGHSMGANVSLLAAMKRPELFKALVLIEPVFMPYHIHLLFGLLPAGLKKKVPIIQKALRRRDTWSSRQDAFHYHRHKKVFNQVSDQVLWDYIQCGTKETEDNQYTLAFSKSWEVHCYSLLPNLWPLLGQCPLPVLGIRGQESDVLLPSAWKRWRQATNKHRLLEIPNTTHLVPLEQPARIANLVEEFIRFPDIPG